MIKGIVAVALAIAVSVAGEDDSPVTAADVESPSHALFAIVDAFTG